MKRRDRRAGAADRPAVADALADVIALLESGMAPEPAWVMAGVGHSDGVPLLDAHSGADADGAGAGVAAACRLAHVTGMPLVSVLTQVDEVLALADEARDGAEAALAGPRMSARILRWLPLLGLGLAATIDPSVVAMLATTPLGWALVGAAGLLTWAGSRWMRSMVAAASGSRDRSRVSRSADAVVEVDPTIAIALVEAALMSGLDVPGALARVADALESSGVAGPGEELRVLAQELVGGAGRGVVHPGVRREGGSREGVAGAIARPLLLAHRAGAPAGPGLRAARVRLVRRARREAQRAAGELGVKLTLPLAACLLPAFTLLGVVPMVIAVVSGADLMSGTGVLGDVGGVP